MSTNTTPNYGMHSWVGTDYVQMSEFNDNFNIIDTQMKTNATSISTHTSNTNNPHNVTTTQIGAAKATDLTSHTGNFNNPHKVTTAQVNQLADDSFAATIAPTSYPIGVSVFQVISATGWPESVGTVTTYYISANRGGQVFTGTTGTVYTRSASSNQTNGWYPFVTMETTAGSQAKANTVQTNLNTHTSNTSNPHSVTAAQVGAYTTAQSDANYLGKSATAAAATKLASARTIALSTDATGSASFDGTANITIAMTLANSGVAAGTYRSVTVDAKGRVTAGTNPTTIAGYGLTDAVSTSRKVNAGTGLTGGGALGSDITLSADLVDSTTSTDTTRPATANSVKMALDWVKSYGLGTTSEILAVGTDLNTVKTTGFYRVNAGVNVPPRVPNDNASIWHYIIVQAHDLGNWTSQMAIEYNTGTVFVRTSTQGATSAVWGEWTQLASTALATTSAPGLTQLVDNYTTPDSTKSATANAVNQLKAYTDSQIQSVSASGIPKLATYEYPINATADNQTDFTIPLSTYDNTTDTVYVSQNREWLDTTDFTIVNTTGTTWVVRLNVGVANGTTMTLRILKNVIQGADGTVNGTVIQTGSMPIDRIVDTYGLGKDQAELVTDANAITINGFYKGNNLTNGPTTATGDYYSIIHNQWDANTASQVAVCNNTGLSWTRTKAGGTWGSWKQLATTDVAQMLKLTNDNGTSIGTSNTDMNSFVDTGVYYIGSSVTTNLPSTITGGYADNAIVKVTNATGNATIQELFYYGGNLDRCVMFTRTYWRPTATWGAWNQTAAFTDFSKLLGGSGWQKLPSGLMIQWGYSASVSNTTRVLFPTTFPQSCVVVVPTPYGGTYAQMSIQSNITTAGFMIEQSAAVSFLYIAIGY